MSTLGPAEIFDLGYQPYEGERRGRWPRRRAIWRDGIRTSLGLGRGTAAKIAPWLLIGLALVPMVVLVVLAAFLGSVPTSPDDFELPSYAEYFDYALLPLGLFAAVVAPLLLCPDRRDGVLSLVRRATDHAARLHRLALGGVLHGRRPRRLRARARPLHLERARRT